MSTINKFTCTGFTGTITTSNIHECYCGYNRHGMGKYDCPKYYSNGERYNECCINDRCEDPTSDVCKNLFTIRPLTIGIISLCCVGTFIIFFCFYRRRRLQRNTGMVHSTQIVRRPEMIELGGPGMPEQRWEVKYDDNNRVYYVDHLKKTSTRTKPAELSAPPPFQPE